MRQRNVHLPCPQTPLAHVVLDYRVLAGKLVLRSQALVDALGGVTLLPRKTAVILQYPVDHTPVRVQLRPARRRSSTIPGRHRILEHLAHRVPVQPEHASGLPRAHTIHHAGPAQPRVHLHLVHPSHLPSSCPQLYGRRRAVRYYSATSLRHHTPARSIITPPFTWSDGFSEVGQYRCVQSVGLSQLPSGPGEVPHLPRIDDNHWYSFGCQRSYHWQFQ